MQEAVPIGKGGMIAVLGTPINLIKNFINEINDKKGVCEIANDNAEGQIIVSGDKEKIDFFTNYIKEKKIKSIPLKVSAPFHCSLMKQAANKMKDKIMNISFQKPTNLILNNVTARPESDPDVIKKLLINQIYSTVRWRESLINMSNEGVKNFIELGPGKVLTGMVKRTIKGANCFSINSIADIKNFINEFKK